MPTIDKAVSSYKLDEYYDQALNLIVSGRAREAFALNREPDELRDRYGRNTFGQSCLLARRLVEAGTRQHDRRSCLHTRHCSLPMYPRHRLVK